MATKKRMKTPVKKQIIIKEVLNIDDDLDTYTRINVPIYPKNYADKINIDFSDDPNFSKTLRELRESLTSFKKSDPTDIIKEVKTVYKKGKLVLVLGAGVSMSFGLPSWDALLQKLMVTTLEKDKNASSVLSKLFSKLFNPSPLIAGRYLQKYFDNNQISFEESVRSILYQEIKREIDSTLMKEIVRYCIAPGNSPNLNSIITYNFDDILEEALTKSGFDLPFKSVYGTGLDVDTGELPIYHVHGYLPEKGKLNESNQITFGENIYHKQYTDTYSWNNIVQINKFRENNCIFIGTSLTDPNTRRLLDIANQQRTSKKGSHYIFRIRYKKEDVKKGLELLFNQNSELLNEKSNANLKIDETVNTLIETIESFEENDLTSFGIKTIWINKYSEIPDILKKIRTN
jgi:hypothetical protein